MALGCYGQVLPVLRGGLQSYFHVGLSRFGLLLSIGLAPGALAMLAAGPLADRLGPAKVLRVCALGLAAAMCLAASATDWRVMLAATAFMCVFSQPLVLSGQCFLARIYSAQPRRVIAIGMLVLALAGAVWSLWAEGLLALARRPSVGFSRAFHLPFLMVAALLAVIAVMFSRNGDAPAEAATKPSEPAGPETLLPAASLVGLMILHGTVDTSGYLWAPRVLSSASFPTHPLAPGLVAAAYNVAYVLARGLLSLIPEERGRRAFLIVPGLLGGSIFALGLVSGSQALAAAGYVGGAFCWSVEYPAMLSEIARLRGARFGGALAIASLGSGLGAFGLSNLMGWLGDKLGERALPAIMLIPASGFVLAGAGGLVWVLAYGRIRTQTRGAGENSGRP